ncbi:MAG: gamma-glutamyltransferase [Hyphomicrobiales bacterium]|nr:gamma-glutamyltransferase [Hyphomicrobiales bacterium]
MRIPRPSPPVRRLRLVFALLLAVALAPAQAQTPAEPEAATGRETKALVNAKNQMVVAAHPLAAEAGLEILRGKGSAVDAAIAAQLVLNLVEPQSSGLGGGAFLLHWNASAKSLTSYDGRETAPKAAKPDRFLPAPATRGEWRRILASGRAVGVPGLVAMLAQAHAAHGRLPWAALFAPAIRLAESGFSVGKRLNALLAGAGAERFNADARAYFFDSKGTPRPVGYMLKNPAFAATLKEIANKGRHAFYSGAIAREIVETVNGAPGSPGDMTLADLGRYEAKERPPICAPYRAWRVCGMGPPSSGGLTVAQALMLLEGFELARERLSPRALHLIGEAQALAYADRGRYLADPDFVSVPPGLLDKGYMARRRSLIRPDRANGKVAPGTPPGMGETPAGQGASTERPGTSHLSIIDARGNAVAMTSTIESAFGSGLMVAGFLLNNELTDFSFQPTDTQGRAIANRVEGGKRPLSSMAPTIVFDQSGAVRMVAGSPGGTRIILYVVKSLIAHLDWGLDAQGSAALINFGSRNRGTYELEATPLAPGIARGLQALGHTVKLSPMTSGTHIIVKRRYGLEGGIDPRREGAAFGD